MIDLEGYYDGITADESFNMRVRNCRKLMSVINKQISNLKKEQKKEKRNWGYSGSMAYVQEKLESIYEAFEG